MIKRKQPAYKKLYFSNRKEYYRRKKISISLKRYYAELKTYFVNFNFLENPEATEDSGIYGSLSSPYKIELEDAKKIIKANCPVGYHPINFYEAEEKKNKSKSVILTIFRNGEDVWSVEINV